MLTLLKRIIFQIITIPILIFAQTNSEFPLSQRVANYHISAVLNTTDQTIKGTEILTWRNITDDYINELQFHLYWNAFKNSYSTFLTEGKNTSRGMTISSTNGGYIDISLMRIIGGEDLTKKITFISPDDGNVNDQTVIKVPLSEPLKPHSTIELKIEFSSKIPSIFARAGFSKDFYMIAQWFPKIGVYEKNENSNKGFWNCHQYHLNSEFFADYGNYNVSITLPQNFIVGASGLLIKEQNIDNKIKTLEFSADDVHDFSWCAYPYFKEKNDNWKDVKIRLLYPPENENLCIRNLSAVKYALTYLDSIVGKYPYKNLTIIDPPSFAAGAGGMEYPTLITTASIWGFNAITNLPEMVTIHEFIHQYFYGILGSNEFEEAWLDEGFTQYMESRVMNHYYGEKTSLINKFGIKVGDFEMSRSGYISQNAKIESSFQKSWLFKSGLYGTYVYMKPAVFLTTLQKLLGDQMMNKILSKYYQKYKFKHPTSADFINIASEIVNIDTSGKNNIDIKFYFEQVLFGTNTCDYAIYKVANNKKTHKTGYFDKDSSKVSFNGSEKDSISSENEFQNTVIVQRIGEIVLPVEVKIIFENGDVKNERWDGKGRYCVFNYESSSSIVSAEIDPDQKIALDMNLINNSYSTISSLVGVWNYLLAFFSFVQNVFQLLLIFA